MWSRLAQSSNLREAVENLESTRVRRKPDLAFRVIGDEGWIVSTRDSGLHRLNASGAFLWEALGDEPTMAALASSLSSEFEVDATQARTDVMGFVRSLEERGLVELIPAPG